MEVSLQTPDSIVAAIRRQWGGPPGLDPCADATRLIAAINWTREDDGLEKTKTWRSTVWCFPPGGVSRDVSEGGVGGSRSVTGLWTRRCFEAHRVNGAEVLAMIPAIPNTIHWRRDVWGDPQGTAAQSICFFYAARVKFLVDGKQNGRGAPIPFCTVYWGRNGRAFADAWRPLGAVVEIRK